MSARDDLELHGKRIEQLDRDIEAQREQQLHRADDLDGVAAEIARMAAELGIEVEAPLGGADERPERLTLPSGVAAAAGVLPADVLARVDDQIFDSVSPVPALDDLDRFVTLAVGALVPLVVMLRREPRAELDWRAFFKDGRLRSEWFQGAARGWWEVNRRWVGDLVELPKGAVEDVVAQGHEVLDHVESHVLGRSPAPLAFLRELLVIAESADPVIERSSALALQDDTLQPGEEGLALARWVAHLVTDVAARLGIAIEDEQVLVALRKPVPGAPADETGEELLQEVADHGEQVRRYLVGATIPSLVEGVIRTYHYLRGGRTTAGRHALPGMQSESVVSAVRDEALLGARLFWAHAAAAGMNAGSVVLGQARGGPWQAMRDVDVAQWQLFAVHTLRHVAARMRSPAVDQAIANRTWLEARWDELLGDEGGGVRMLYEGASEVEDFRF